MKKFEESELTLNKNGKVYHLNLGPDDIADTVIVVGDQNRVKIVSEFFDSIRFKTENREFYTVTGSYKGKEISVVSTGIGTDNIDIVINELDAAVNIDLEKRVEKEGKRSLSIIRIGTCGALQEDIDPGSIILTEYALGLDGVAGFYNIQYTADEKLALKHFFEVTEWNDNLNKPYIKRCSERLENLLSDFAICGITATANGFYGPQGRAIRIPLSFPDFKENLRKFEWSGNRMLNLEMESSALYTLSSALGHEAITVCLVLANRYSNKFMPDYKDKMDNLIQSVLDGLTK